MINTSTDIELERFPIRELSLRTGVNSVTLRAWERRYGLLKPFRTEKGHRLYTSHDVTHVEKILYWINQGVSVSKVRALLDQRIETVDSETMGNSWRQWQEECVAAVRSFSQNKWEKQLQETIKQYPFAVVVNNGVLPVLAALTNDVAAKRYFQSSLAELLTTLKLSPHKSDKSCVGKTLLVCCDGESLMAKLIAWGLAERKENFTWVEGVTSREELIALEQRLDSCNTIIVAERYAEHEAKQWLVNDDELSSERVWIGSGLWLRSRELRDGGAKSVYSSVAEYLQVLG